MNSLYDKNHRFTPEAEMIYYSTCDAVGKLFKLYESQGFSPREISQIMQGAIMEFELEAVLNKEQE